MKIGKLKISRTWAIIILIAVLICGYYILKNVFKNPLEGYVIEEVGKGEVSQEVSETGSVRATKEASLSFKSMGRIAGINVDVGDNVKKGDVLAVLDAGETSAQLQAAKASLLSAQTEYEKLLNGLTQQDIQIYQDAVESAEQDLQSIYDGAYNTLDDAYNKIYNAYNIALATQKNYFSGTDQSSLKVADGKNDIGSNMESVKNYINKAGQSKSHDDIDQAISNVIASLDKVYNDLKIIRDQCDQGTYYLSVSDTDKGLIDTQKSYINSAATSTVALQTNLASYKLALQKANNNLVFKTATPRQEDIDIYKSQIEQARANVDLYQSQAGGNYIYSPIDGKVTAVNAKKGEVVNYSESIIKLLSSEPFQIKVDVYEQDIVNVDAGDSVRIDLVAFQKQTFEGKVLSIDPAEKIVDNVVYYEVTIDFPDQPEGIRSGMTADITIDAAKKENVLRIPKNVVETIGGKEIVQVVKNKKVEDAGIETGLEGTDYYEVVSGLSEGDKIVISTP